MTEAIGSVLRDPEVARALRTKEPRASPGSHVGPHRAPHTRSVARGRVALMPTQHRMRIAFSVGLGHAASTSTAGAGWNPSASVVGLCDSDSARRGPRGDDFRGRPCSLTSTKMLARAALEVVVIGTRRNRMPAAACAALRRARTCCVKSRSSRVCGSRRRPRRRGRAGPPRGTQSRVS